MHTRTFCSVVIKLGYSETEHVNALYCLDILTIAARALVGFSRTEKISDLQNLTDLLQEVFVVHRPRQ